MSPRHALMAGLRRRKPERQRPTVVLPDRPAPDADPAWSEPVLRKQVVAELAEAKLYAARDRAAGHHELLVLAGQLRTGRLAHAEALVAAGGQLLDEPWDDLVLPGPRVLDLRHPGPVS